MHRPQHRFQPAPLVLAVALAFAAPGLAQAQSAQGTQAVTLSIAAQPLGAALNALSAATGVPIGFAPGLVAGKSATALQGNFTPKQAVDRLLAGSGLIAAPEGAALVIRTAPPAADAATLGAVTVTAEADRSGATEGTGSYTTRNTSIATGLNLTLRETPQSVTVVTRQRMDDQGLNSLNEVTQQMIGVSSFGQGGGPAASYSWFNARGFSLDNVLLDGTPIPVNLFGDSVDSIAYDSISLIRGANGLIAGSGEPSGTLSLTRKRPTDSFAASGSLTLGQWAQRRATIDVGGPLIESGRVRGRLAVAAGEGKSWLQRYNENEAAVYGIVEADVGPQSRVSLSVEHGNTIGRAGGPYQLATVYADETTPTPFSRGENAFSNWSFNREKRTNVTVGFDHRFNEDWTARGQYIHSQGSSTRRFGNVSGYPEFNGEVGLYGRRIGNDLSPKALSASVDGRYRLWGREHQVVLGFNGYSSTTEDHRGNVAWEDTWPNVFLWQGQVAEPNWDALPDPWARGKAETTQYGVYVSNRLKVLDSLAVITGARLSNWRYRYSDMDTGEITDDRKENRVFTPYLGLVYDLSSNLSAYASYTTIFQPNSQKDQAGRLLDPQDGKSYEVGLKGAWFNNRLNASAAIFQTRKNNLAVPDGGLTPTGDDAYVATDHTRSRGWEVEVAGELLPGWQLQAGYGRAVIRDSDNQRLLTEAPKETLKLFTTWTPRSMQALTVGGGLYWQSEAFAGWAEGATLRSSTIKPYTVVNLMARYRINPKLSLTVNLNNLFDRVYRVDETGHDYGAPRNLRATLNYQY